MEDLPKDCESLVIEFKDEMEAYDRLKRLENFYKFCNVLEELKYAHTFCTDWDLEFGGEKKVLTNICDYHDPPGHTVVFRSYKVKPCEHWFMCNILLED